MQDVALDKINVIFCIDRAGLVGDDGPTHHGNFDISYLNTVPGAMILAPRDEKELRDMMYTAVEYTGGPVFIRYPRGVAPGTPASGEFEAMEIPLPKQIKRGADVALISLGDMYNDVCEVHKLLGEAGIAAALIDARFAKPLDVNFYKRIFTKYPLVATFENNTLSGGFGSSVLCLSSQLNKYPRILTFGFPDEFIPHGDVKKLKSAMGLTPEDMAKKIIAGLK